MTAAPNDRESIVPRAKKKKGKQRAREILETASIILVEDGYGALTMRAVASAAGITMGNLQYYFPTKDDLWKALLMRTIVQFEQSQEEWLDEADKREDSQWPLMQAIDYLLADQKNTRSCSLFWELWALSTHDAYSERVMRDIYELYISKVQNLILLANNELTKVRAGRLAVMIVSMIEGVSLFRGGQRPPFPFAKGCETDIKDAVSALVKIG